MSKKDKGFPWKAKPTEQVVTAVDHQAKTITIDSVPVVEQVVADEQAVLKALEPEVLPAGEPFLALGIVKRGPHWYKVEIDCELVGETARAVETRIGRAAVRAQAVAEFKQTAVRKKVTA